MKPVLVIADPAARLRPAGDTTLVLVRDVLRRRLPVHWATPDDIELRDDKVVVHSTPVLACEKDGLPQLDARTLTAVEDCRLVLIRKDPPFDTTYVRFCWLLALAEKKVRMLNPPSVLLRYHEKMVPLEAVAQGFLKHDDLIPTHLGNTDEARAWVREGGHDPIVSKPFLGYGGNDLELMSQAEFLASPPAEPRMIQPFVPEVRERGDRRVFFLAGKLLCHVVRMPKPGGFISNLAQGGTAVSLPLTPPEKDACDRLGRFLAHAGIELAGADLIGRKVSEVNITSPTGLRAVEKLEGKDYADVILDYALR